MAQICKLPTAESIRTLLSELTGDTVKVRELTGVPPVDYIATYFDKSDRLQGVLLADLGFAASSGGKLAMLPRDTVEESVKAGELSEDLNEAFYEVVNIMASLMCGEEYAHARLVALDHPAIEAPIGTRAFAVNHTKRRCQVEVDFGEFGGGQASFILR